jgi:beta-phosphoglucomutase-like phosphatase (HAD superfamily)
MELSRVQAVLLDMDGTLVDSDAAVERAWLTWASEYRVNMGSAPLIAHGMPALGNVRRLRPDLSETEAAAAAQRQLELQYDDVADVTAAPGAAGLRRGCSSDQGSAGTRCSAPAVAPAMPSSGTDSVAGLLVSTLRMPVPWPAS